MLERGFLLSVGPALGHRKKPAQGHRPGKTGMFLIGPFLFPTNLLEER